MKFASSLTGDLGSSGMPILLLSECKKIGVTERRPTAMDSVAFSTLQQKINRGCDFIYMNAHGVIYIG